MGRGLFSLTMSAGAASAAGQHVGVDTSRWIHRFSNCVVVVAGYDDRIAVRIDTADDADVTTTATPHYCDSADLRATYPGTVAGIRARQISAASMTGPLEHQIHECTTP